MTNGFRQQAFETQQITSGISTFPGPVTGQKKYVARSQSIDYRRPVGRRLDSQRNAPGFDLLERRLATAK